MTRMPSLPGRSELKRDEIRFEDGAVWKENFL